MVDTIRAHRLLVATATRNQADTMSPTVAATNIRWIVASRTHSRRIVGPARPPYRAVLRGSPVSFLWTWCVRMAVVDGLWTRDRGG